MDPGFFELKTADQLFAKLEDDFQMARADSLNSRLWFNFFVTAEHIPEWHFKDSNLASKFRKANAVLRVCSHIANGGKHFEVTDKRHNSIAATNITYTVSVTLGERPFSEKATPPKKEKAFNLHLSPEEAKELGAEILVTELAGRILDLYRKTLLIPE
ncbi:MAG: hypothetical protein JST85_02925 [Acidobacteria bacterium]|nr:hypothetical protein [Acidobacteriota bacterium]